MSSEVSEYGFRIIKLYGNRLLLGNAFSEQKFVSDVLKYSSNIFKNTIFVCSVNAVTSSKVFQKLL